MEQRYKLTIFSKNIYQEIELLPDTKQLRLGTTLSCDVRLRRKLFFEEFEIELVKNNEVWNIQATENIYLNFGGNRKIWTKPLEHGEQFEVRYNQSDAVLFSGRFFVDFDYETKQYNRVIDLSNLSALTIGTEPTAQLQLQSEYVYDDHVSIRKNGDQLFLCDIRSQYGVYRNGKQVESDTELKSYDFFSIANFSFYYRDGRLYTDRSSKIAFHDVQFADFAEGNGALQYPQFHRNTRIQIKQNEEEIPLLAPKEKPQKPKSNLVLKLLPALSMIALTVVLRGMMGSTNMSFVLFSVCSMSVGALVSVFTIINDKKEYREELAKRDTGYRAYIAKKQTEIEEIRAEETNAMEQIYYPYTQTSAFVRNFTGDLYDRTPEDEDFLDIRVGTGAIDAIRKIEYKKQETYESDEDELVVLPMQLSDSLKQLQAAPVVLHGKEANVIGIVGTAEAQYEMMKILFFDLCVRQYYHDVNVFLFVPSEEIRKYEWVKWFRHLENDQIGCRNIICDEESKNAILEYLYAELSRRKESKDKEHLPHLVIFSMKDYGIHQHPVSKYIEKASELGCTFLFFETHKEYIPVGCSQLLLLDSGNTGRILLTEDKEKVTAFSYMPIADQEMFALSHRLAPVYCEEISLEASLTKNITLYQLLGIFSEKDLDLRQRWASSDVTKSMAAPLGVRAGNEIVYLDIHDGDKHHGPHGLVAGTTGSGKSEILMTYILSMITLYSPYDVAFVIIDFKGGGMGNQFKDLPHTLGVITDIDGKEINRSLVSIQAELERRKKLFKDADVDHIDKYIKLWKSKKIKTPLPHLIIIVDEFAELKAQFPDFMEQLKSAARIGRTLGVHLILATQKPQGQVDPQIDSNSKFRLCLKVQTPEDSREVIKTPLAAEIREAGRAYLLVGNNEVFELFQSAYSGASAEMDASDQQKEFSVSVVDFAGRRKKIYERKHQKKMQNGKEQKTISQKEAIVGLVNQYFASNHFKKLSNICQPSLLKEIPYTSSKKADEIGIYADLGIFDDPAQQRQDVYTVNMALHHMLIIGSLQTGKTNILQLIVRSLTEKYTPEEVNIYVIDYASMILTNYQSLAHVGGVVVPRQNERLNNLFKLLNGEISKRNQKFQTAGVSSYTAYKEAGNTDMPLILLLIDNLSSLRELDLNDNPVLYTILREGLSVGISVVAANGNVKLENKYLSMFSCKIGLHHNDGDVYGTLFGTYKLTVDAIPGRCLVEVDRKNLDCQIYQSFEGEREKDRVNAMKAFISGVNAKYLDCKAALIPEIPKLLTENELYKQYPAFFSDGHMILGFDYDTMLPIPFNLVGMNLILAGTPQSGKRNFVRYMLSCLHRTMETSPVEIVIFDKASEKRLESEATAYADHVRYELSSVNMAVICKEWKAKLEERKQRVIANQGNLDVLKEEPLLLMLCEDSGKEVMNAFDEALLDLSAYKFTFIASNVENEDITPFRSPKLYKVKSAGAHFLWFGSYAASNIADGFTKVSIAEKRGRLGVEVNPGDAFYVEPSNQTKVYRIKTPKH